MKKLPFLFGLILCNIINAQLLDYKWLSANNGCEILDPYYSEGVKVVWNGPCKDGKAHGFGTLIKYVNDEYESTYEGEYKNGIREGKGKLSNKDGTVASGYFTNGQLNGKGTRVYEDGRKFEGNFLHYEYHGDGIITFRNGDRMEGFFVSGKLYTGTFTQQDGSVIFIQKENIVDQIVKENVMFHQPKIGVELTEYFDAKMNRCEQKDASFYRIITYEAPNKPKGVVKDYYISGELRSEFNAIYVDYEDEEKNFYEGKMTLYYKNQNPLLQAYYYNNKLNGEFSTFYEDGSKKESITYSHGYYDGPYTEFYKNGKTKLQAHFKQNDLINNTYTEFDESGNRFLLYHEPFSKFREQWEYQREKSISTLKDDALQLQITAVRLKTCFSVLKIAKYFLRKRFKAF